MPNLSQIKSIRVLSNGLIRISTLTGVLMIHALPQQSFPRASYELYDNQTSMYLVLSWNMKFSAMCIDALL